MALVHDTHNMSSRTVLKIDQILEQGPDMKPDDKVHAAIQTFCGYTSIEVRRVTLGDFVVEPTDTLRDLLSQEHQGEDGVQFDVKINHLSKNEKVLALEQSKKRFSDIQLKRQVEKVAKDKEMVRAKEIAMAQEEALAQARLKATEPFVWPPSA